MTDKKLTDTEIIKALESEICLAEYVDNDFADNVSIALFKDTLNLINRQKSEIERLNQQIETAKFEAVKEFAKLLIDKMHGKKISSTDILDFAVDYLRGENNG